MTMIKYLMTLALAMALASPAQAANDSRQAEDSPC